MTETKRSSKALIYDSRQFLYCVYRAPGDWNNPDSISFIGADGDGIDGLVQQIDEKLYLQTETHEWSIVRTVPNPANGEINTIWRLGRATDHLQCLPAAYGGLMCVKPSAMWGFESRLSPAALSIMLAMPELFDD